MKKIILGGLLFLGGILGLGMTHIAFVCSNWSEFYDFVINQETCMMYYYVLSWITLIVGIGVLVYEVCFSSGTNGKYTDEP